MKKNTMRIAALLMALVLITTAAVGSTFAKYTTKGTYQDNARIAYWGFASYVDRHHHHPDRLIPDQTQHQPPLCGAGADPCADMLPRHCRGRM